MDRRTDEFAREGHTLLRFWRNRASSLGFTTCMVSGSLGILMKGRLFMIFMRYGRSDVLRHDIDECYERVFQCIMYGHAH